MKAVTAIGQVDAKIAIFYYLRLLTSEYSRDSSSKRLRKLIAEIYQNDKFGKIACANSKHKVDLDELFVKINTLNEIMRY